MQFPGICHGTGCPQGNNNSFFHNIHMEPEMDVHPSEEYDEEDFPEKEVRLLDKYLADENSRKIYEHVFDKSTIQAVHTLAKKGHFTALEFVVSTGKEAHVFKAADSSGNFRAIKIYDVLTSDFRNMEKYIAGDIRFKKMRKGKRELVFAWTKKEYRNLELLMNAGTASPQPVAFRENVLVMEFIGEQGAASPTLKDE